VESAASAGFSARPKLKGKTLWRAAPRLWWSSVIVFHFLTRNLPPLLFLPFFPLLHTHSSPSLLYASFSHISLLYFKAFQTLLYFSAVVHLQIIIVLLPSLPNLEPLSSSHGLFSTPTNVILWLPDSFRSSVQEEFCRIGI